MKYFDDLGFPCQDNGDVGDSAQRVGWIETINVATRCLLNIGSIVTIDFAQLFKMLEVSPGVYVRHPKASGVQASPKDFSRDQQTALRKALILRGDWSDLWRMFKAHASRGFKYQNKDWGLALTDYVRGFLLWSIRLSWYWVVLWFPVQLLCWYLLWVFDLSTTMTMLNRIGLIPRWKHETHEIVGMDLEDVDDLNHFLDHVLALHVPTPISYLNRWAYKTFRPKSLGNIEMGYTNNVYAAIGCYFRVEWGGNPALAVITAPLIKKYFS